MSGFGIALGVAGGVIATNAATGALIKYVPQIPAQLQTGLGKVGLKFGVGVIALPMVLKLLKKENLSRNVAAGGWAAVILDLYTLYLAPSLGLGDYEYVSGYQEIQENSPLGALTEGEGMGVTENMYADTMYGY